MQLIDKQPLFASLKPAGKFWLLMFLFMLSLVIFSLLAAIIMIPFSDVHTLSDIGKISDYNNPNVLLGLKIAQTISAIGTFIIPALVFSKLVSGSAVGFLKIDVRPKLFSSLIVVFIMITVLPLINWMAEWNSKMVFPEFLSELEQWMKNAEEQAKQLTEAFLKMDNIIDLLINLFVVAFLAAFSEELMFRGAIQQLLMNWIKNKHLAIWSAAFIFSAFHFQFYGFLPRMVLGALLGYLFIWSGSLWLPVFAHFMNNAMAVIAHYFVIKGVLSSDIETIGENNELIYTLPGILLTVLLLFFLYKTEKKIPAVL